MSPTDKEEVNFGGNVTGDFVGVLLDDRAGFSTEEPADDGGTEDDFLLRPA